MGGAAALAEALPASKLTTLSLYSNSIGDAGAAALAKALPASKLTVLFLGSNSIGDAGAAALVKALPASKLTWLDLHSDRMGGKCGTGADSPSVPKGRCATHGAPSTAARQSSAPCCRCP